MKAPRLRLLLTIADSIALFAGRITSLILRKVAHRNASAGPGLVVNAIAPGLLGRALARFPSGLVIVTGSSGKSTTTRMLSDLLEAHGLRVFTNSSTANLRQGVASAVVDSADWLGRIDADIAVIELDEAAAAQMSDLLGPRVVVLTNVMSDQLDRFRSVQHVSSFLLKIASRAVECVVANQDDQLLCDLARQLRVPVSWFGAAERLRHEGRGMGYAVAAVGSDRSAGTTLSHVSRRDAVLDHRGHELKVRLPARGIHYGSDAAAAIEAARSLLGVDLDLRLVEQTFNRMVPVFGRGEVVTMHGEAVELVLVQNTSSFQLNLDQLQPRPEQLFVAVGSDVRDSSWLWSVDMSGLDHVDVVSGSRAFEIATRLAYDSVPVGRVTDQLPEALSHFLALPAPSIGVKTIIFTAESMRSTRRILGLQAA